MTGAHYITSCFFAGKAQLAALNAKVEDATEAVQKSAGGILMPPPKKQRTRPLPRVAEAQQQPMRQQPMRQQPIQQSFAVPTALTSLVESVKTLVEETKKVCTPYRKIYNCNPTTQPYYPTI